MKKKRIIYFKSKAEQRHEEIEKMREKENE